jgi:hypothetical protein
VIGDWGIIGLAAVGLVLAVFPRKSGRVTD